MSEVQKFNPVEFYEEVLDIHFDDYVMLMNDPGKEMKQLYEIKYDRHMQEGGNWKYLNLETEQIKKFAIDSLQENEGM